MANIKTQMLTSGGDKALPQFDILKTDTLTYTTMGNVTAANRWYRVATITAFHYPVGLIWLSGIYGGYRPTVALLSFAASGSTIKTLTQIAGAKAQGITKVRLVQLTGGVNQYAIEVYYDRTTVNGNNSITIACTGETVNLTAPTLVPDTPADGNVSATLTLGTVPTGVIQAT